MTKRNLHGLMAGFLFVAMGAFIAQAATGMEGETEQQFRYEWKIINGQLYRLDKKTGKFEIVDTGTGDEAPAVKGETNKVKTKPPMTGLSQEDAESVREPRKSKRNRRPLIELPGDPEEMRIDLGDEADYVPHEITESHRRRAARDIAAYKGEIGIAAPLQVSGDLISGTINVENKGKRKLLALELTIFVPTATTTEAVSLTAGTNPPADATKPESKKAFEHHVLFSFKDGHESPPSPNLGPTQRGRAVTSAINVPFQGLLDSKGKIEVRVTYLKFDE